MGLKLQLINIECVIKQHEAKKLPAVLCQPILLPNTKQLVQSLYSKQTTAKSQNETSADFTPLPVSTFLSWWQLKVMLHTTWAKRACGAGRRELLVASFHPEGTRGTVRHRSRTNVCRHLLTQYKIYFYFAQMTIKCSRCKGK